VVRFNALNGDADVFLDAQIREQVDQLERCAMPA